MRKTAARGAVMAALLWAATPAAGQESALRDGLNDVARDIAKMLTEEAGQTGERLRVSFRPARTTPLKGTDIYCGPLSFGLRNALHERVEWHMRADSFDVVVANERAVEPPDVTMSWAWDGAESVSVEAHVLLPGDRYAPPYRASLPVSKMGERERACLFTYRPGGGEVEAKTMGFLRDEPSVDPAGIVHPFEVGERFRVAGELSSEGGSGAVWSVVPWKDPETETWLNLFTAELAGDAVVRDPDDEAPRVVLPAARQERTLGDGLDDMARNIAGMLNREAEVTGERLRVTFRPARTVQAAMDIWCGPLSSGLRNALHERVQWWGRNMGLTSFEVTVADARAVEPPDVTLSWAWDGAESVRVEAHVLLAGEGGRRGRRYLASLDAEGLGDPERACLFAFRPGGGEAVAETAGILREEPTFDPAGVVRLFRAGEPFLVRGELSSAGENGVVWSVVLGEDPETGRLRYLFAANLTGDAAAR